MPTTRAAPYAPHPLQALRLYLLLLRLLRPLRTTISPWTSVFPLPNSPPLTPSTSKFLNLSPRHLLPAFLTTTDYATRKTSQPLSVLSPPSTKKLTSWNPHQEGFIFRQTIPDFVAHARYKTFLTKHPMIERKSIMSVRVTPRFASYQD
jgi:hypothetical protein